MNRRKEALTDIRDVLLTLLLPPVGLLFVGHGLVRADRRPSDVRHWALAIVLLLLGAWLTFVIVGLMFAGQSVQTTR